MTGRILKGVGGFYYVLDVNEKTHECKARGRFRNDGMTPLPGDFVRFSISEGCSGLIEEILPRKNELKRPRVVNVDMIAIVVSVYKPPVDKLLCDKLIIYAKKSNIQPVLVINKCDAVDSQEVEELQSEYRNVCPSLCVSAATGEGLDALKSYLAGCCTCFAGQSATGKSSLLNALFAGLSLETGGLSKKVDRGRHTTRHAELMVLQGFSGTVVDTPGFSFLEANDIQPSELCALCDDLSIYSHQCRFISCLHDKEPQCSVKAAVADGLISKDRYQRYLTILNELQEAKENKYD